MYSIQQNVFVWVPFFTVTRIILCSESMNISSTNPPRNDEQMSKNKQDIPQENLNKAQWFQLKLSIWVPRKNNFITRTIVQCDLKKCRLKNACQCDKSALVKKEEKTRLDPGGYMTASVFGFLCDERATTWVTDVQDDSFCSVSTRCR